MEKLRGGLASGSDTAPGYWPENLEHSLRASKVKMSYGLSTTQLSLRHLLAMKAGDIVPIDGSSAVVKVNTRELFSARLSDLPGGLSLELKGRIDQ
jgi:flagellar motor switch protein FliM